MKQGLSFKVSQNLALTPQLQQSIRLLQLSTLEMEQEVEQMLGDNPFLERDLEEDSSPNTTNMAHDATPVEAGDTGDMGEALYTSASTSTASTTSTEDSADTSESTPAEYEADWDGDGTVDIDPYDTEWGGDAPAKNANSQAGDTADATELARSQESLTSMLHRQAQALRLSPLDRAALMFLIESLNDDGYLEDPLETLVAGWVDAADPESHDDMLHRFTLAHRLLLTLEPTGVGAQGLAHCLTLQLQAMRATATTNHQTLIDLALNLCQQPLDLLARRDSRRLNQLCGGGEAKIRTAMALIAQLEPKPGRPFISVERNIVIPDVLVRRTVSSRGRDAAHRFTVQLNPEVMPRLRVHDLYANALRGHKADQGHQGLQQRLQEARWFIKNIQQRFDTILRVSNAIVERQKNFFIHGALAMRPLVLREIAEELGLHESTISRVTTAKYMSTPVGTYELKYFFGSGLDTDTGGNASSTAVRALIEQLIRSESASKPLSDNQLSEMLKAQGIECARRTVAKYREAMKIAPASLRRTLS